MTAPHISQLDAMNFALMYHNVMQMHSTCSTLGLHINDARQYFEDFLELAEKLGLRPVNDVFINSMRAHILTKIEESRKEAYRKLTRMST